MKNRLLLLLTVLVVFVLPTTTMAMDFNWIYFHYENSKLAEYYSFLSTVNDVFETYFTFESYISLVVLAYTIVALIVSWDVLRGKKPVMVLWEKFIWTSLGNNIITRLAIIIAGYFIFLFPVPVIQVAPIVSYDTTGTNTMTVKAWLVDAKNSNLGTDASGNIKLLHVPMILGVPLGLAERFVYGFPTPALAGDVTLNWDSNTKRHTLTSVTNDWNIITDETSGACPITDNTVDSDRIADCDAAVSGFKPNSFSILGNTLEESASVFVNVAAPFKSLESLLKFQKSFLNSIVVEQDALIATDKLKKNADILNKYVNNPNPEASEKYMNSIEELFEQRVIELNKIILHAFQKYEKLEELTNGFEIFSAYIRAYSDQLLLEDLGRVYSADVINANKINETSRTNNVIVGQKFSYKTDVGDSDITPMESAIEQRNAYYTSFTDDNEKLNKGLFFLNNELTTSGTYSELSPRPGGDYIHNANFDIPDTTNKIDVEKIPFALNSTDFKLNFDITRMEEPNGSGKSSIANQMLHKFWENYKTKIFDIVDNQLTSLTTLPYYQDVLTKKILNNMGIRTDGINFTTLTNNLTKYDKLTVHLFILDALIGFMGNKITEAEKYLYGFLADDWEEIDKMTSLQFKEKYYDIIKNQTKMWKQTNTMIMGLAFDDFSFKQPNEIGNNAVMIMVKGDDQICQDIYGTYTCGDSFFEKKNKGSILSFLCENDNDENVNGICVINLNNNKLLVNQGSLKYLNTMQNSLFTEVRTAISIEQNSIVNYDKTMKTKNIKVFNPCLTDNTSVECAKFVAQEQLKNSSSSLIDALNDSNNNKVKMASSSHLPAVLYVYSGLLRNHHDNIIQQVASSGEKVNPDDPICNNGASTGTKEVKVTGAEAYNNIKQVLEEAMRGTSNYIGNQVTLLVNALGALSEKKLKIGASGWSASDPAISSSSPQLELDTGFTVTIESAMVKAIEDKDGSVSGTTCDIASQPNPETKALCQVFNEFTALNAGGPSDNKLKLQLLHMVRFLALSSATGMTDSSLLTKTFKIYADTIGSFYNRNVLSFNADTFAGIEKLQGIFNTTMGGNFKSKDDRTYSFTKIHDSPEKFKEELILTEEMCASAALKINNEKLIANNQVSAAMDRNYGDEKSGGLVDVIVDNIIMFLLALYTLGALMIPFLYILIFSIIATAIGWIGATSIAYITMLNILVLRNFEDIDIINNHWKEPSKKMTIYFSKAVLSSILLYIYLVVTIFIISHGLVPLGETITMYYIVSALVSSKGLELSMWFHTVTFILVTIFLVYMRFSLRMVKDWFTQEIMSPTVHAIKHAEQFAQRLTK